MKALEIVWTSQFKIEYNVLVLTLARTGTHSELFGN